MAVGIPLGTSEPIASDPGGNMPGPSDARRPVDHPTPFEPTECFNLTRKASSNHASFRTSPPMAMTTPAT
ncbi:hypothetical protein EOS93_03195 [Rhizobium sp. RMa-01]|nr:hypothetical protein EOS93_03195 [Rhizobium sp. RMa-01]